MKTLDEVIKKFEICNELENLCSECPYIEERCSCDPDALHYLKTYQANQHAYEEGNRKAEEARERYMEAVKNCEVAENKYKRLCKELRKTSPELRNEPLTWDELRQMEGKPVWVEVDEKYKGWVMVGKFYSLLENEDLDAHVNLYCFGRSMEYSKEMYGFYWQAYRKERN